jgi:protease I
MENLKGMTIAILVEDGFEQVELSRPRIALDLAGAATRIVSPRHEHVRAWNFKDWGEEFAVDIVLTRAQPSDFHALLLPGGVMNPDALRMQPKAVEFVKAFFEAGKPVAVICHGPWTVIEAGAARGRRIASWPSLRTDLRNAGAEWVDEEVVVDDNLVSSRKPDDIPAFNREMIAVFSRALGQARPAA